LSKGLVELVLMGKARLEVFDVKPGKASRGCVKNDRRAGR